MVDHQFGGDWTEQKLNALKSYLEQYRLIFTQNEKARFFNTIYIDAFAGTGERKNKSNVSDTSSLFNDEELPDLDAYKKGSARIALELSSPFNQYIFIDKNAEHINHLESAVKEEYPHLVGSCKFICGDGPATIHAFCTHTNWKTNRAVLFLDPYGMNVEWDLLCSIAKTKAIDLWLLFPLGTGANRLLTRDGLPEKGFSERLTKIFGTEDWKESFYKKSVQSGLFGEEEAIVKDASFEQIGQFFISRLKTIFADVSPKTKALYNSRKNPMYLLCFAVGNQVGAPTAIKIANHLLRK